MKDNFLLKVFRNALILGLYFFVSSWAGMDYSDLSNYKPLAIFVLGYVVTELARHYHVSTTGKRGRVNIQPLIF